MSTELSTLYQELILDHNRHPRNFRVIDNPSAQAQGFNPICGDKLTVYLQLVDSIIVDLSFLGCGCAISQSSASLMTEALRGKTIDEARQLFTSFHNLVTGSSDNDSDRMGSKLAVFRTVSAYPARVKCATLAWHTLQAALNKDSESVSTE